MALTRIPLLASSSGGTPTSSSPQRIYNLYPSISASNKTQIVWKETPGWEQWGTLGILGARGMTVFQNKLYAVAGNEVTETTYYGARTLIGNIATSTGRVSMAEDGILLLIADGNAMYSWDGTTLATISLPTALTKPTGVIYHDGHFICYNSGSGEFWISNKTTISGSGGGTWDPLDYAVAEDKPDNIVGLASDRVLWVFGEYTTQAYFNNGEAFPFAPNPQGLLIYGMVGDTQAQLNNTSYWLARSKWGNIKVVKANGYAPEAVSDAQLEEEFATFTTIDDAYANTIMWQGHEWYVLTFPTEGRTFVFDTQGMWFEWGEYDSGTDEIVAHPMTHFVYFNGLHLFSDDTGRLQQLTQDVYNHDGKVMMSGFKSNVIHVDEQRMFINSLVLDMRTGLADKADIELRVSFDGGYTWGDWQTRSMGKEGDYNKRVEWHRLGSGYNCVIQVRITDEVPRQFMSGAIGVSVYESYLDRRNERAGI